MRLHPFEEEPTQEPEPETAPPREAPRHKGKKASFFCLAALLIFQGFLLRSWIGRETRPPAWDQANHLEISLDCRRALAVGELRQLLYPVPKPGMPPFPPLYHLSILYAHSRPDPVRAALWVNWFYLAVLALSIWGLGRFIAGPWVGFIAALLFTCAPEVQGLYFSQLVDLALTAWVAAAYWALVESHVFRRSGPSALFGVLFAAAALTKWNAPSYFFPALILGLKAAQRPGRRRGLMFALALAAGLPAPWYLVQLPVLVPRLISASSDNAMSFWHGGALSYVWQMIGGLDFPLWLLSLVALIALAHQLWKDGWIFPVWFIGSYAFWMLVPNHQLRYLLPGITPLVVVAAAVWPRWLLAVLCGYQVFVAANYSHGWIPARTINLGVHLSFFNQQLPAHEDWKIGDILKAAQARHDKAFPFGNLTLVANHPYFNGPNFNWAVKSLGLDFLRIRGVNRRLCEFSEFLVVKTGSLGPELVVNQLPEVQKLVLDKKKWFQRSYREVGRWPLPDQTEAVLFERRPLDRPPVKESRLSFDYYEEQDVRAKNLVVDLGPWDSSHGVYTRARVRAKLLELRGLEIQQLDMVLEDLVLVPLNKELEDFRFLRLKRLTLLSGMMSQEALADFVKSRLTMASRVTCRLDKTVSVEAVFSGVKVQAEASIALTAARRAIVAEVLHLSLAGVPIPTQVLGRFARVARSLEPDPDLPFEIATSSLKIAEGRLLVGESGGR